MKKTIMFVCILLFFFINLISCSKNQDSTEYSSNTKNKNLVEEEITEENSEGLSSKSSEDKSSDSKSDSDESENIILSQRKIIRNADITIKVDNFEKSYTKLKNLVEPHGYIQDSNLEKYEETEDQTSVYTSGTITLRVNQEEFENILEKLSDLGTRTNEHIYTEDVTDKYYDIESRLKVLKYEQKKLEEYLENIDDPDTIFKYEDKLTEIRQEIESLTGNINKLNDLVKTSTITVTLTEKYKYEENPNKPYYQELLDNLKGSSNLLLIILAGTLSLFTKILPFILFISLIAFITVKLIKFIHKKNNSFLKNKTNKNSNRIKDTLNDEDK